MRTYWIAIRVPSATKMKSCRQSDERSALARNSRTLAEDRAYRQAVDNDRPLTLLDDVWQDAEGRCYACVATRATGGVDIDAPRGASLPVDVWGMDSVLYIRTTVSA